MIAITEAFTHASYAKSHSNANFVGSVVGFLNVCIIRLVAFALPPRYHFKCNLVLILISPAGGNFNRPQMQGRGIVFPMKTV